MRNWIEPYHADTEGAGRLAASSGLGALLAPVSLTSGYAERRNVRDSVNWDLVSTGHQVEWRAAETKASCRGIVQGDKG